MKSRWIKLSLILNLFLVGGMLPASLLHSSQQSLQFSIALPQQELDISDLDVRDANNQPIKSVTHVKQIQELFIHNLNQMLLENLTPIRRMYLNILSQSWDITSGWLKSANIFIVGGLWAVVQKVRNYFSSPTQSFSVSIFQKQPIQFKILNPNFLSLLLVSSVQILR